MWRRYEASALYGITHAHTPDGSNPHPSPPAHTHRQPDTSVPWPSHDDCAQLLQVHIACNITQPFKLQCVLIRVYSILHTGHETFPTRRPAAWRSGGDYKRSASHHRNEHRAQRIREGVHIHSRFEKKAVLVLSITHARTHTLTHSRVHNSQMIFHNFLQLRFISRILCVRDASV